jgi:hypothetical protein
MDRVLQDAARKDTVYIRGEYTKDTFIPLLQH